MLSKEKINKIFDFLFFFSLNIEMYTFFLFGHKLCWGGVNEGGSRYDRGG